MTEIFGQSVTSQSKTVLVANKKIENDDKRYSTQHAKLLPAIWQVVGRLRLIEIMK